MIGLGPVFRCKLTCRSYILLGRKRWSVVVRGIGTVFLGLPVLLFLFLSPSFMDWVKVVPTQPPSLMQTRVIQTDMKELLEGLKMFSWFYALRYVFCLDGI